MLICFLFQLSSIQIDWWNKSRCHWIKYIQISGRKFWANNDKSCPKGTTNNGLFLTSLPNNQLPENVLGLLNLIDLFLKYELLWTWMSLPNWYVIFIIIKQAEELAAALAVCKAQPAQTDNDGGWVFHCCYFDILYSFLYWSVVKL